MLARAGRRQGHRAEDILGVVVVGVAIEEALDAYELRHAYPEEAGSSRGTKVASRETEAQREPQLKPEPAGQNRQPPVPLGRTGRASCEPVPVPHAGNGRARRLSRLLGACVALRLRFGGRTTVSPFAAWT